MSTFKREMLWLAAVTAAVSTVLFSACYLGASREMAIALAMLAAFAMFFVLATLAAALIASVALAVLVASNVFVVSVVAAMFTVNGSDPFAPFALLVVFGVFAVLFTILLALAATKTSEETRIPGWRLFPVYLGTDTTIGFGIYLVSLPLAIVAVALPLLAVLAYRRGIFFVPRGH